MRRIQPFLWVASAVAVAYTAWVFTGRLFEHKTLEHRTQQKTLANNPQFDRTYGGSEVRILEFYARDGVLAPGKSTLLCYGVLNATEVRIEPAVDGVRPALNRCVDVAPQKTTSYTLSAAGANGANVSRAVTIVVR
jgi:hypothetical protein